MKKAMAKSDFPIGNCFKCGKGIPERDKIWEICGLCEECRIETQKKDRPQWESDNEELIAWAKLKAAFPKGKYVNLEHDFNLFRTGREEIIYQAYVDLGGENRLRGKECKTAMEAVDDLLEKVKEDE